MKNLIGILFFFLTFNLAFAQINFSEAERKTVNGTYKSYLFELPNVEEGQAEEDWKQWIESLNAKTKFDNKNDIWYAQNVKIPKLSKSSMNVYANISGEEEPQKRTSVIIWFALGEDYVKPEADSLSITEDSFNGQHAVELLTNYAMTTSKNQAGAILKMEENKLDKYVKDLKKLQKDVNGYQKSIEKANNNIAKNEKNIESNLLDQVATVDEIEIQKLALEMAKEYSLVALTESETTTSQKEAEAEIKSEEKLLVSLEKDLKKLKKDNENYYQAIEKAENTIALKEMKIEINDRDQKNKVEDIETQKEIIVSAKEKVNSFIK